MIIIRSDYDFFTLERGIPLCRFISQSRKCSQIDNLHDCISRLWVRSDIHIRDAMPQKRISKKSVSFQENYPLSSLSEYYIKELVID